VLISKFSRWNMTFADILCGILIFDYFEKKINYNLLQDFWTVYGNVSQYRRIKGQASSLTD